MKEGALLTFVGGARRNWNLSSYNGKKGRVKCAIQDVV